MFKFAKRDVSNSANYCVILKPRDYLMKLAVNMDNSLTAVAVTRAAMKTNLPIPKIKMNLYFLWFLSRLDE